MYYYRARYYDAAVGRFISKDPIGFEDGTNVYIYAKDNPVLNVDPKGLSVQICYSPLDSFIGGFPLYATHISIKSSDCGTWGFYPRDPALQFLVGPGEVRNDSQRAGLSCSNPPATSCVDEQCVCSKIANARVSPGPYGLFAYNCQSWARQIITDCSR